MELEVLRLLPMLHKVLPRVQQLRAHCVWRWRRCRCSCRCVRRRGSSYSAAGSSAGGVVATTCRVAAVRGTTCGRRNVRLPLLRCRLLLARAGTRRGQQHSRFGRDLLLWPQQVRFCGRWRLHPRSCLVGFLCWRRLRTQTVSERALQVCGLAIADCRGRHRDRRATGGFSSL